MRKESSLICFFFPSYKMETKIHSANLKVHFCPDLDQKCTTNESQQAEIIKSLKTNVYS